MDNSKSFFFRYAPPGDPTACPAVPTTIGTAVKPTSGSIYPRVSRTIPLGSVAGTGEACWSVTNNVGIANEIAAPTAITVN